MTAVTRSGLFAALLALGLFACPPVVPSTDGGGGGAGGGSSTDCFVDTDCPDPTLFFCNLSTSKCEAGCRQKSDCSDATRGQYKLDYCAGGLGCQCDDGKCVGSRCGSDLDCGTQVCRDGNCVDAPAASTVTKCTITPDVIVAKTGSSTKVSVSAWDSSNKPVVLKTGVTWSAAAAAGTITGEGNSVSFTASTTPTSAPIEGPKATIGTTSCTANVSIVDGTVTAGSIRAVVTDELTGRGIANATVLASDAAGEPIGTAAVTDATGIANLTLTANAVVNVTAFHNDFNYLTISGYDMAAGTRVLSFVVRRNQVDLYGGQKGTFTNVPATSNVHAGIAGMSIAGSITDLSLTQLLGNSVPTRVKIGNAIDQMNVPLPAGVFLGFSDQQIKPNVAAQGLAGVCGGAGAEDKIKNGTCGTRSAWALVGDVPLGDLPISKLAGGLSNIDFGGLLADIIPIFRKFNSSIVRDVEFSLKAPGVSADGGTDFADTDFTSANHDFQQMPLVFNFVAKVPDLPKYHGTYSDAVVLLGGASVPGRGVIPLGLGIGVNSSPADEKIDKQADLGSPGLVSMRMAPTHAGIEGSEYGVIALALSIKGLTGGSGGISTSGVFGRVPQNQLAFDPKGTSANGTVTLPSPFVAYPESAKYNFTNTAQGALAGRHFIFAADPGVAGTSMVRVVFTDGNEHRWVVYGDSSKATTTGLTVPKVPAGGAFLDRTFSNGMASGSRSTMLVQLVRLNSAPATTTGTALTFTNIVELNDTNADRLTDFTTGFSFTDYGRPGISWKTPAAGGTVAKGSTLVVTPANFRVGTTAADDGQVKVTFTGGTGCIDLLGAAATAGTADISLTLPVACTGAVQMKATLADTQGNPIVPEVSSTISATITP